MSNELKPCPFCGANDAVETDMEGMRRTVYFVSCNKCGAAGPSRVYPDHSQPLTEADLWNRRAAPAPEQSDRERARMFLSGLHIEGDDGINRGPIDPQSVLFSLAALLAEVRAEERERCAKAADKRSRDNLEKVDAKDCTTAKTAHAWAAQELALLRAAIRKGEP